MPSSRLSPSRLRLPRRLWLLLCCFAVENILAVQLPHPWFNLYLYRGLPIVFGLALIFFGRRPFREFFGPAPFRPGLVAAHVGTLSVLAVLEAFLLFHYQQPGTPSLRVAADLWVALLPVLVATLLLAFLPFDRLLALGRALGPAWLYAAVSSALVFLLRERFRLAWGASSSKIGSLALSAAFHQSQALLRLFYPVVVQDPASHLLGTDRFLVIVGGTCSGLEGLALMTAFATVWLIYARHELRLGRALLLVPVALLLMWALNLVRLVALIAIGDAGHPAIATQGFHSEAGWIAFNVVSLGFLYTAQQITWFRKPALAAGPSYDALTAPIPPLVNVPAVYLGPFLAITAAAVLSQAASAGFEWLYPLRFFAALAVLWLYRKQYRRMDWRCSALGPVAGLGVAAFWLGLHHLFAGWGWLPALGSDATGTSLAAMSPPARDFWIAFRILSAVLTVPVAEELAFRGYVARRLMSSRPEQVPYARLGLGAIVGSSLLFGAVHGRMWLAGILAGLVFAGVARWKGRLGDAVGAHVAANLALALAALHWHDYNLW